MSYDQKQDKAIVEKTIEALKNNGINAMYVATAEEAKQKVHDLIPDGAEVMTMTSITLETIGLATELNDATKYHPVRDELYNMDRTTQDVEMRKLGSAPALCEIY